MTKETKAKINALGEHYQKIMFLIITILIGYIATIAGGVKTDIEVLKTNTGHMVQTIKSHEKAINQHNNDIHEQDTRLVLIESKIKTGG